MFYFSLNLHIFMIISMKFYLLFSMQTIIMQSKVQRQRIKKIFLITTQQMFRWTVICSAPAPMPAAPSQQRPTEKSWCVPIRIRLL